MPAVPKLDPPRDRVWLDWLHTQPCILTGFRATQYETIDPLHLGTLGKGIKSPDNECLPVRHKLHAHGHQHGEISMLREHVPDWLLREALRAYAKYVFYPQWIATAVAAAKPK